MEISPIEPGKGLAEIPVDTSIEQRGFGHGGEVISTRQAQEVSRSDAEQFRIVLSDINERDQASRRRNLPTGELQNWLGSSMSFRREASSLVDGRGEGVFQGSGLSGGRADEAWEKPANAPDGNISPSARGLIEVMERSARLADASTEQIVNLTDRHMRINVLLTKAKIVGSTIKTAALVTIQGVKGMIHGR